MTEGQEFTPNLASTLAMAWVIPLAKANAQHPQGREDYSKGAW